MASCSSTAAACLWSPLPPARHFLRSRTTAIPVLRRTRRPPSSSVSESHGGGFLPSTTTTTTSASCSSSGAATFVPGYLGSSFKPFYSRRRMENIRRVRAGGGSVEGESEDLGTPVRTRKIVEHVALFKMNESLTDEQEKDMLDNLWSLQYRIRNVLCTTVGRLVQKTPEGYTHALFSRFPSTEALHFYMESPARWQVAQDLVMPYYNGKLFVDFEADVEDDIETVFRRGDDFQEGLEHMMFFRFKSNVSSDAVEDFMTTARALPEKYENVVQLTIGTNLESQSKGTFSHGLVARFLSEEAHLEYEQSLQNDSSWLTAVELLESSLTAHFLVSPVGKTVM